jgi:hypothetical protein
MARSKRNRGAARTPQQTADGAVHGSASDDGGVTAAGGSNAPSGRDEGARLSSRGKWILLGVLLVLNIPMIHRFLIRGEAEVTTTIPFREDFNDSPDLSEHWSSTGGLWRVVNGALFSPGVKNNPLWLQARLPDDVRIEFTARATGREGDVKVELFGDGSDHASGYVLIHGGWDNSVSIIARLDEHGRVVTGKDFDSLSPDARVRVESRDHRVISGRTHRWRIEREGKSLRWFIDGRSVLTFEDPHPLRGPGHDRFGFSSWLNDVTYDDLVITPL